MNLMDAMNPFIPYANLGAPFSSRWAPPPPTALLPPPLQCTVSPNTASPTGLQALRLAGLARGKDTWRAQQARLTTSDPRGLAAA